MSFFNTFRKGLGVVVGAAAGIGHFTVRNAFTEWRKIMFGYFIAHLFLGALPAFVLAASAVGIFLAYKMILNFFKNMDSTNGNVVEHTPLAEAMLYGCQVTNDIAGPSAQVHPVIDRRIVSPRTTPEPFMQKIIDGCDGVAFSSHYRP